MRAGYRRVLLASLGELAGVALGLDRVERSTYAERFADGGFGGTDDDLAGLMGYAMRQAARELEARGWRSATLAAELDRIVNARTRARQAEAHDKRTEAIRLREAGEKVSHIARTLGRTERWVYDVLPENLKRRR
jgi:hypothetical protein